MSIKERLTRLNVKSQSFTDSGGGIEGLSPQELAACLAGAPPIGEYILWRRYVGRETVPKLGKGMLLRMAVERVQPLNLKIGARVADLLDIALDGYIGDHKCPKCQGRKYETERGITLTCNSTRCRDGAITLNGREIATLLGVSYDIWRDKYRPAFNVIDNLLTEVIPENESNALRMVIERAK